MAFSALETGFLRILQQQDELLCQAPEIAIACSGGLDSVVLAYLAAHKLKRFAPKLKLLHVDHNQRKDSKQDLRLVQKLATQLGLKSESKTLPLPKRSSEEVLRDARTQALKEMTKTGAVIFTAHHAQDQLETYLLRVLRGAHGATLTGIPFSIEKEGRFYLRPLLSFWKEDLEVYARGKKLMWHEDSTNTDIRFARNHLRTKLLPLLEEIRPKAQKKFLRFFETLKEECKPEFLELKTAIDRKLGKGAGQMTQAQWSSIERSFLRHKEGRLNEKKTFEFPGGHTLIFLKGAVQFDNKVLD